MTSPCVIVFIPEEVSNHLHSVAPSGGYRSHSQKRCVPCPNPLTQKPEQQPLLLHLSCPLPVLVLRTQMCRCKILAELLHRLR